MTDILVTSPFRPFTLPTQFKAVFNGYIYCGTVDAVDPSVSQVQVYLVNESGDKVPVAQPLRTNAGGYLVYNGQPAKFVTDSNHSLLVQDSFHVQVWYAPDMSAVDPEAAIEFIFEQLSASDGLKLIGACDDFAALKATTATNGGQQIYLRSYVAGKNLGGGIFQWDATSTKPDDAGCVVSVTGAPTGRWMRQYDFIKTPEMFGALGDGITDDTAALQRMFDSANNSPILAENFFGSFSLKRKHLISSKISAGRPIYVNAYGAEFVVTFDGIVIEFSMHNGLWEGGFFDHMTVPNASITEASTSISLAPETNPIQVMNSAIRGVRSWGAHTPIKFNNPNTAIWQVELSNLELAVRSGSSLIKARPIYIDASGGAGGSTTVTFNKVHVFGKGGEPGVGMKGYIVNGVNDATFNDCSYDWFEVAEGVPRTVGEKDVFDVTAFRATVVDFHTEQLVNDTDTNEFSPMYFNTNSLSVDGVEMLLTDHTNDAAWMWIAGNGSVNLGRWHDLPKAGATKGRVVNVGAADPAIQIFSTGSVRSPDIIGGKSRLNLSIAGEAAPYHTDFDINITSGQAFYNLPQDSSVVNLSVIGCDVADSTAGFAADLILVRDGVGNWNIESRIVKMLPFVPATVSFTVVGQQVVLNVNNAFTYRVQTRLEWKRAVLSAY